MSTDFNKPVATDNYASLLAGIQAAMVDLARQLEPSITGTHTNVPTGAVRFNAAGALWERFNGTSWVALASVYNITVANATNATNWAGESAMNLVLASKADAAGTAAALATKADAVATSAAIAEANLTDWIHSGRDFPNGTLITTSINYSVSDGDPFVLEIRGNSYGTGNGLPFDLQVQGYIYSNTIINRSGLSNGNNFSGLVAINVGGFLCFWFPSQGYWAGYSVRVYTAFSGRQPNKVTSITSEAKPAGATKEVSYSGWIRQSWHSENFDPSTLGSGRLVNVQRFTSSGTYTRSSGVTKLFVEAMGGGGGGGSSTSGNNNTGLPGGGGEYQAAWRTTPPIVSLAVTVGAGGAGAATTSSAGSQGGSSFVIVDGSAVLANGGLGGVSWLTPVNWANNIISGGNYGVRNGPGVANSGAGGAGGAIGASGNVGRDGGSGWVIIWEFT
jgi:hypothetical protein